MGEQLTTVVEDDLYERVCAEHTDTGKSKSKVVAHRLREAYQDSEPTLDDSVLPVFGQGLFVGGFVIAGTAALAAGVAIALAGLALMIGAKVDLHMQEFDVGAFTALKRVLGA